MPEYSAEFQDALRSVLRVEGEFSDHPADPGGKTRYGITESEARKHGYDGPMEELPADVARRIYHEDYWAEVGGSALACYDQRLAEEVFDTAVNMGTSTAITFLQRSLNVLNRGERDYRDIAEDGIWGPETNGALDSYIKTRGDRGLKILLKMLNSLQGARYVRIAEDNSKLEAFMFGWFQQRVA